MLITDESVALLLGKDLTVLVVDPKFMVASLKALAEFFKSVAASLSVSEEDLTTGADV